MNIPDFTHSMVLLNPFDYRFILQTPKLVLVGLNIYQTSSEDISKGTVMCRFPKFKLLNDAKY